MSGELQPLSDAEEVLLATADAYAAACADQEEARAAEPYDNDRWQACCTRSQAVHSKLLAHAKALSERHTDPPELRPGGEMFRDP